jgi:putative transposase
VTIETVREAGTTLGIAPACAALGLPTATYYRRIGPKSPPEPRPSPPRKLATPERATVLEILHEPRFLDLAPAQVFAQLLDEDRFLCSERTMYRILAENQEVRERRDQLRHPHYAAPELLATAPNQVWSWDITKLLGPAKWTYFYLYVILDIFSRYVVGWMVAHHESAALAKKLIEQSCRRQGITPGELTLHADRGPSMTSKPVALLLSDLGVTKTHSRPYVSNDNPFSEAQFKTMKYRPNFPERFGSIQDSRGFGHVFFPWYNTEHRHTGLGLLTPHEVHYGLAEKRVESRARVLAAAYAVHPERFVAGLPRPPALPTQVWINKPTAPLAEAKCDSEPEVVTDFALTAPYSPVAHSTHTGASPRIVAREPSAPVDSELHIAAVAPLNTEDLH